MNACGWRVAFLAVFAGLAFCSAPGVAEETGGDSDSTVAVVGTKENAKRTMTPFPAGPADTLKDGDFRSRHAFSLDHFFEFWPEFVIGRRGPIGGDADFSRYGIGRGRGVLYLGSVPLNDPQDDRIPLALVPTTPIGEIVVGGVDGTFLPERTNIEGAYRIVEPAAPVDKPVVAIELSRGDRGLRQRRARFSTVAGPIGVDFEFDELLNDGYAFDARGIVQGSDYGRSTTRCQGGNVRGELPGGAAYLFSFRRFQSTFDGDLVAADHGQRRDGHVAVIRSSIDRLDLSIFERSHKVSAADSATSNHTAGVYAAVPVTLREDVELELGAGYEDIQSRQRMGDEETQPRLQKGHFGVAGRAALPARVVATLETNATHYFDMSTGWGAAVTLGRRWGSDNEAVVAFRRRFRMPNLGELFQPRHSVTMNPSLELAGNRYVKPEAALEGSAAWFAHLGGFANAIRATAVRVQNPIVYDAASSAAGNVNISQNGAAEDLVVFSERAGFQHLLFGVLFELAGSVEYTPSERARFFSSVPEYRATAWAAVGSNFFGKTSGFRLSTEYQHGGTRNAGSVEPLPSYDVVNLKLVLRLIDAHLYVQWLNVTDAKYQTVWPYLMTPRTFVYGVEWTIFD
jgi:hypothetical protein